MASFPSVTALAEASFEQLASLWSGLGYYARARSLHRAAQQVCRDWGGVFPSDFAALQTLPGVGRSTAAAIAVFSRGERAAILDANVRRVLARYFGVDAPVGELAAALLPQAEALLPPAGSAAIRSYTQGLMDLGALLCTPRPRCITCPVAAGCVAQQKGIQATLPRRAVKPPLPHKRTLLLLVEDAGRVLFLPRPAKGIWGGLWSLPQVGAFELCDPPAGVPRARTGKGKPTARDSNRHLDSGERAALAAFVADTFQGGLTLPTTTFDLIHHQFTHFSVELWVVKLPLAPLMLQLPPQLATGVRWLAREGVTEAPLPAPQKRWLLSYFADTAKGAGKEVCTTVTREADRA